MSLIYRNGTVSDIPQLQQVGFASYGQFKDELTAESWQQLAANVKTPTVYESLLKSGQCFVCEKDNTLIGMAFLIPSGNPTEIYPSDWSYIRFVGVNPKYAGNGIGRQLTKMCIDHAKAGGEKIIGLHTSEMMDAARHIYEGFGFKIAKEIAPRFGKRYWLYQLNLYQS